MGGSQGSMAGGAGDTTEGAGGTAPGGAGGTAPGGAGGNQVTCPASIPGSAGAAIGGAGGAGGPAGAGGAGGAGGRSCQQGAIDIRATVVSGTITVNGVAGGNAAGEVGVLVLRTPASDGVQLGMTSSPGGSYSALVVPGTYDLFYEEVSHDMNGPHVLRGKIRSGIVVGAAPLLLNIDVRVSTVTVAVAVNGVPVKDPNLSLALRSPYAGYASFGADGLLLRPAPGNGTFALLALPGTYDLLAGSTLLGGGTTLRTGIVVGAEPVSLSVDVPTVPLVGKVTVAGATISATLGEGVVYLANATSSAALATTSQGSFEVPVIPGTYDLFYAERVGMDYVRSRPENTVIPGSSKATLQRGIVIPAACPGGAVRLDVDVPSTRVTGTVTMNGAAFSDVLSDRPARLTPRSADGDSELLTRGFGFGFPYTAAVVPGMYDVYYQRLDVHDNTLPSNSSAKLRGGVVIGAGAVSLDIDLPVAIVTATLTINGAPIDAADRPPQLVLRNAAGDEATLRGTVANPGSFSGLVIAGTYDLYYVNKGIDREVPSFNVDAKVQRGIVVGAAPLALTVDVPFVMISGPITLNGAAIDGATAQGLGLLTLYRPDGAFNAFAITSAAGGYSSKVLPGVYGLYYGAYRPGPDLPANNLGDLGCFIVP